MTSPDDKLYELASREATEWLMRLADNPDSEQVRARFEKWLRSSEHNEKAWQKTQYIDALIARIEPVTKEDWPKRAQVDRPRHNKPIRQNRYMVVLGAGIAACLALLLAPDLMIWWQADYRTGVGQTQSVTLDDGSEMILAPDTAIRVTYNDSRRRLDLLSGEAFFTVEEDPNRPFSVSVHDIDVIDLGTAFSVRREESGGAIAVAQGRVRVEIGQSDSVDLGVGQKLDIVSVEQFSQSAIAPERIAVWRHQRLIVEGVTLEDAVGKIKPYIHGRIIISDETLREKKVTGVYDLSDPVAVLEDLAAAHNAHVRNISPWLYIVSLN